MARARENEERGRGTPLTDVERACRHYGITPEQYYSNPGVYPLPARGTGLSGISQGPSMGATIAVALGALIIGFIVIAKKA